MCKRIWLEWRQRFELFVWLAVIAGILLNTAYALELFDTLVLGRGDQGPISMAVNPQTNRIYILNAGSYMVIDGESNEVVTRIPLQTEDRAYLRQVAVNPNTNRLYVTYNSVYAGRPSVVMVVDTESNRVVATIELRLNSQGMAVNPKTNRIYVAHVSDSFGQPNIISVIDGGSNRMIGSITLGDYQGTDSYTLAVNPETNRIYAAQFGSISGGRVLVVDGEHNQVIASVAIEQAARGIEVDPITNRIYITHYGSIARTSFVTVMDGDTNEIVTGLWVGERASGIAISAATNRIYVTHGEALDRVSVLDQETGRLINTIQVGEVPGSVAINPETNRIYVANGRSSNISVIDGINNQIITIIQVGWELGALAINPQARRLYVTNGNNNLTVINSDSHEVIANMHAGHRPVNLGFTSDVAVNSQTNRVYVADLQDGNYSVLVIDGASNRIVATIPIEDRPLKIAVNPRTNRIYVLGQTGFAPGVLRVIDGATNQIIASISVSRGSMGNLVGVAVNPETNRIYLTKLYNGCSATFPPTCAPGNIVVIDGATNQIIDTLEDSPTSIVVVNPYLNLIYVVYSSLYIVGIDGRTNSVFNAIQLSEGITGMAIDPDTDRLYVAHGNNTVSAIDAILFRLTATVRVGRPRPEPTRGIAFDPDLGLLYVTNSADETISVLWD